MESSSKVVRSSNKFRNKENLLVAKVSQWRNLSNNVCMNTNVLRANKFNQQKRLYKEFSNKRGEQRMKERKIET
jgi:hypothetical protein